MQEAKQKYCDLHIVQVLTLYHSSGKPLDALLRDYFRDRRQIGSQARRLISDILFGMIRNQRLIQHLCPSPTIEAQLYFYKKLDLHGRMEDSAIPEAIRFGVSDFLYERLCVAYSKARAQRLCRISNSPAPTTLRANLLKTTREQLLAQLPSPGIPCKEAPAGISLTQREPLFTWPSFREGLFEVQDEGSQRVAQLVAAKPGDHFLDYCSGSGGKALAVAPTMQHRGQIYLHDVRSHALEQARLRLRRAGVQNALLVSPDSPKLKQLKGKMDWVLADVPCSGSGTLRRNPELKEKIDAEMVKRLVAQQREIFAQALIYLKPGGSIVYSTCSILPEENQSQVEFFIQTYSLKLSQPPLAILPEDGGSDGFFAAVMSRLQNSQPAQNRPF